MSGRLYSGEADPGLLAQSLADLGGSADLQKARPHIPYLVKGAEITDCWRRLAAASPNRAGCEIPAALGTSPAALGLGVTAAE